MKLKNKFFKIIIIAVLLIAFLVLGGRFFYAYYFIDKYEIIKPLPAEIPIVIRVDKYGDGHFGAKRRGYRHRGIDLKADVGTPVLACKGGWVEKVTYDDLSGNYLVLAHRDGTKSYYLHLEEVSVKPKRWIRQGQVIGLVGKTGNADAPDMITHLHFEIRKNKRAINILKVYELEDFKPAK
jgi:murein DD-endopeptidase MepM/ murein hydrolase activator NlpD